jgi:hypothetical protein
VGVLEVVIIAVGRRRRLKGREKTEPTGRFDTAKGCHAREYRHILEYHRWGQDNIDGARIT